MSECCIRTCSASPPESLLSDPRNGSTFPPLSPPTPNPHAQPTFRNAQRWTVRARRWTVRARRWTVRAHRWTVRARRRVGWIEAHRGRGKHVWRLLINELPGYS
eukprot:1190568-Prorocentrum_minimum.AAC.5